MTFEELKEKFVNDPTYFDNVNDHIKVSIDKATHSYLNKKNLGYLIIDSIYEQLGIGPIMRLYKSRSNICYDLDGLVKHQVIQRILNPDSKLATFDAKNDYLDSLVDEDSILKHIYRSLDILGDKYVSLQKSIFNYSNKFIKRDMSSIHYDLTNYYFEIKQNDEDIDEKKGLRKKGVSKENRKIPIVQMGLCMDKSGYPICFDVFPGNILDSSTVVPILKNHINNYGLEKVIFVADRICNNNPNIEELINNDNGYIISRSILKATKDFQDYVKDDLGYDGENKDKFKVKSRIIEKSYNGKTYKEKQVVYWSKEHYDAQIKENKHFQDYLNSVVEHPKKLKDNAGRKSEFLKVKYTDKLTGEKIKVI
jgi:hypothetical protein